MSARLANGITSANNSKPPCHAYIPVPICVTMKPMERASSPDPLISLHLPLPLSLLSPALLSPVCRFHRWFTATGSATQFPRPAGGPDGGVGRTAGAAPGTAASADRPPGKGRISPGPQARPAGQSHEASAREKKSHLAQRRVLPSPGHFWAVSKHIRNGKDYSTRGGVASRMYFELCLPFTYLGKNVVWSSG